MDTHAHAPARAHARTYVLTLPHPHAGCRGAHEGRPDCATARGRFRGEQGHAGRDARRHGQDSGSAQWRDTGVKCKIFDSLSGAL